MTDDPKLRILHATDVASGKIGDRARCGRCHRNTGICSCTPEELAQFLDGLKALIAAGGKKTDQDVVILVEEASVVLQDEDVRETLAEITRTGRESGIFVALSQSAPARWQFATLDEFEAHLEQERKGR